jgi:hypothetical protein
MSVEALIQQALNALTDPHMSADVRLGTLRALLLQIDDLNESTPCLLTKPGGRETEKADPIAQAVWALRSTGRLIETRLAVLRASMQALHAPSHSRRRVSAF